ncbi:hypothetical protein BC835DRAFT_1310293, partial [Cytidiella melzeri]
MSLTAFDKGKERALPEDEEIEGVEEDAESPSEWHSDSDSDSDSNLSLQDSDSEEEITQQFLDSLLQKARQNAIAASVVTFEEDVIQLGKDETEPFANIEKALLSRPLPSLNPGTLPTPYIDLCSTKGARSTNTRDLDAEQVENASTSALPLTPALPPSALPKSRQLTKKEQKALKTKTAGASWFDLPAPSEAELPKLYREVEALRLRNQLDPKRFYRKEAGEGKGIKGLPKYFA